jgi:hypothetical protein
LIFLQFFDLLQVLGLDLDVLLQNIRDIVALQQVPPLLLDLRFELVQFVPMDDWPLTVSLEVEKFSCLQDESIFFTLISSLLFVLVLVTLVGVCLAHMTTKGLRFGVLLVADGTNIFLLFFIVIRYGFWWSSYRPRLTNLLRLLT